MSENRKPRGNKPRISSEAVHRAFLDWINGTSLRKLKEKYGFSKDTYRYQFIKLYGEEYASLPRCFGTYRILKEYLKTNYLSNKQKREVKDFIENYKELIIYTDISNGDVLYTESSLNSMSITECSKTTNDYRYIFENMYSKQYQYYDEDCQPLYDEQGYLLEYASID